jgi:hypothetical protein
MLENRDIKEASQIAERDRAVMLREAHMRFIMHLEAGGGSPHTMRSYGCDLRALVRFLGEERKMHNVTANDLSLFLTSDDARIGATGKLKSPGAVNRLRAVLRSFFGWLYKTGQIGANPACCLRVNVYKPPATRILGNFQNPVCAAADNNNLNIRGQGAFQILGIQAVSFVSPPVCFHSAGSDYDISSVGSAINHHPAELVRLYIRDPFAHSFHRYGDVKGSENNATK